jgi:hypothetical protein
MLHLKSEIKTLLLLFLSLSLLIPMYGFSGGTGTLTSPFEVNYCYDLDNISNYLSDNFIQMSNIDCGFYSSGSGFDPIGGIFTGSYDGNGLNISNLFINRSASNYVGLFNQTTGAIIINTKLININISGNFRVGGLVGHSSSSSVSNSYSSGSVDGAGNYVGGLLGYTRSSSLVSNSYSSGSVDGVGDYVGGLLGFSDSSTISNSSSSSSVFVNGDYVGGLIGYSYSSYVSNSSSSGAVTGASIVGGFIGNFANGDINNSYSSGIVDGTTSVGGLIGYSSWSSVSNSYSTGTVNGTANVGGLLGKSSSSVSNSFSTGAVSGNDEVGGFIGDYAGGTIITSFWNNHSGNVNQTFGSGTNINVTPVDNNISRFYGNSLVPMLNWDPDIWDFYNTTLPHLAMENYVVVSSPAPSALSSVSSVNLSSFGFGAVVLALIGIVLFLF